LQKQPAQTSLSELSGQGDAASDLLLNSGVSETLDNNLFVPHSHPALENSKASTGPNNQMIPLQDAKELLAVFSAVLPFAADREEVAQIGSNLQRLVGELPKLLAGKTNDQQAIANVMDGTLSVEKTEESDGERIVAVAPVKSKLELLAAKAVIPEAVMKQAVQQVAVDSRQHSAQGMQSANQPVQIDDLLKTMNPKEDIFAAKTAVPEAVTKQAVQQVAVDSQPNSAEDMQSANLPVQINDLLKTVNPKDDIIKLPSQPVPVQRFSEEMAQFVVKNLKITLANGISEAKISLAPEHLGNVDVKITIHNGQVVAQFMADSVSGKEMLESQLAQLRTNLQNQGIQVHKLEVTQNQSLQSGMFQDPRQQQSQQQSNRQTKGKNNAGFDVLDEDAIQEVIHSLRNVGDGNSFDVTA
jgi:flagellar hook-length control protein FliK